MTKTQCSQINKYFLKEKERTQSYAESQTLLGGDIKSCVMIKTCTHYADMVSGDKYFTRSILEKWNIIKSNHLEPRPRPCAHQSCRGRRAVAAFPRTWQPHDLCLLRGPWDHNSLSVPTMWLPSLAFCLIHSRLACACSPGPRAKLHLWGVGSGGHRKAVSQTTRCFYHLCVFQYTRGWALGQGLQDKHLSSPRPESHLTCLNKLAKRTPAAWTWGIGISGENPGFLPHQQPGSCCSHHRHSLLSSPKHILTHTHTHTHTQTAPALGRSSWGQAVPKPPLRLMITARAVAVQMKNTDELLIY